MKIYSEKLAKDITSSILGQGTSFGGKPNGKTKLGENNMDGFVKQMQTLSGTTKEDRARRAQNQSDDLVKRADAAIKGANKGAGGGVSVAGEASTQSSDDKARGGVPNSLASAEKGEVKDPTSKTDSTTASVSKKSEELKANEDARVTLNAPLKEGAVKRAGVRDPMEPSLEATTSIQGAQKSAVSVSGDPAASNSEGSITIKDATIQGGLTDLVAKAIEGNQDLKRAAVRYDREAGENSVLRRKLNEEIIKKTRDRPSPNIVGGSDEK